MQSLQLQYVSFVLETSPGSEENSGVSGERVMGQGNEEAFKAEGEFRNLFYNFLLVFKCM